MGLWGVECALAVVGTGGPVKQSNIINSTPETSNPTRSFQERTLAPDENNPLRTYAWTLKVPERTLKALDYFCE
eukprot:1389238-Pyramimonas_sp.AAC.1